MSCNFMPCNFDSPSFSCPSFSVNLARRRQDQFTAFTAIKKHDLTATTIGECVMRRINCTLAVDTMFCSLWLSTPINYSLTSTAVSLSRRLYRLLNGRTTSLALLMPLNKLSTKLSVTVDNAIRSNSLSFAYKSENGLNDNEDQPSQMHRPGLQFS